MAEVETLVKELIDTILAFRDIAIDNKLAVYPLIIDRVELFQEKGKKSQSMEQVAAPQL